jgi:hypothetical protein
MTAKETEPPTFNLSRKAGEDACGTRADEGESRQPRAVQSSNELHILAARATK